VPVAWENGLERKMKRNMYSIGQTIKAYRIMRGLSQSEVARRSHQTRSVVTKLESEYYGSSVGRLIDVLDAIGCHIEIVRNEIEPNHDKKLEEFLEMRRVRKKGMNQYGRI
jgi:transcriptional regulator with XRE-family HTH domain